MAPKPYRQIECITDTRELYVGDFDGCSLDEAKGILEDCYKKSLKTIANYDLSNRPVEYEKTGNPIFVEDYDYYGQPYLTVQQRYQETDESLSNRIKEWEAGKTLKGKFEEKNRLKNAKEKKEKRRKMYEELRKEFE